MVGTGFERHVGGRATSQITGRAQRMNFGMGPASARMPALADDDTLARNHAADTGIG